MEPNFNLRNKNILVTGGAGFIGSNLCEYLLTCEANVTCLDNFATGHLHNIEEFLSNSNFKLIKEVKVKHGPSRKGDIPHSLASIKKSQKLLLYTPSHFIENGLKESIKYYFREKNEN